MLFNQYVHIAFEAWGAVFCLLALFCVVAIRNFNQKGGGWLRALLCSISIIDLSEALAYYYRGNETTVGYVMVRVTNFFVFLFGYFALIFFANYVKCAIEWRGGVLKSVWFSTVHILCVVGVALLILSRFFGFYYAFDSHNRYYRSDGNWIMHVIGVLTLIALFVGITMNRQKFGKFELWSFYLFIFGPQAAMVWQMFHYGISISNIVNTIMAFLLFVSYLRECVRYIVLKEREEANTKILLYERQIQPHFIYNTLAAIRAHLPDDSEARDLLNHFITFLRGNIDTLTETQCISARKELKTVENYLYIERARYEDQLKVVWDIQDVEFELPAFTVQLLVENAIRHGIRQKPDGAGTIVVRTYETNKEHVIVVEDDGVGFDPSVVKSGVKEGNPNEERAHVGLQNLRKRLEMMCGGRLEIQSTPQVGTTAKIFIPKE